MTDNGLRRELETSYEETLTLVPKALQTEGFGVLTEIDVKETLKKKLGIEFGRYKILGACNPQFAYRALQTEADIGVMMPCNVVVQDFGDRVEVSAINPMAAMQAVGNADLAEFATTVSERLKRAIENL